MILIKVLIFIMVSKIIFAKWAPNFYFNHLLYRKYSFCQ